MASLAKTTTNDDAVNGCWNGFCRPLITCLSCFGFRFDSNNNYFYNIFRSFVFITQTILWVGFLLVLQGAIDATFQYLASGKLRVMIYWLSCLVIIVLAMVFTHIYMRLNTPEANFNHYRQVAGEHLLQSILGRSVPMHTATPTSSTKKKKKKNPV